MNESVQVSVYCLAYNHEKYIRKTLDGFVKQKTDFQFRVFVHDDASTDGTAGIIREYEKKYPYLIEGIYQSENQYSKGGQIIKKYIAPKLEGKYVAACEGDDYWLDENKLQKQFEIMERDTSLKLCLHKVERITERGEHTGKTYPDKEIQHGYMDSADFLHCVCTDFFQLTSYFWRLDVFREYLEHKPEFARVADIGDIPLLLYLGSQSGKVFYINEMMSCYRVGSTSSVVRAMAKNVERQTKHLDSMLKMIRLFDQYTDERYHRSCIQFEDREIFTSSLKTYDILLILKHPNYRLKFIKLPIRIQISVIRRGIMRKIKMLYKKLIC